MAIWNDFDDFDKKMKRTWTTDIDLSGVRKAEDELARLREQFDATFESMAKSLSPDQALQTLYKLEKAYDAVRNRAEQLGETYEMYSKLSEETTGGTSKQFQRMANAASMLERSVNGYSRSISDANSELGRMIDKSGKFDEFVTWSAHVTRLRDLFKDVSDKAKGMNLDQLNSSLADAKSKCAELNSQMNAIREQLQSNPEAGADAIKELKTEGQRLAAQEQEYRTTASALETEMFKRSKGYAQEPVIPQATEQSAAETQETIASVNESAQQLNSSLTETGEAASNAANQMGGLESVTESVSESASEVNDSISGVDSSAVEGVSEALQTAAESSSEAATSIADAGNASETLDSSSVESATEALDNLQDSARQAEESVSDVQEANDGLTGDQANSVARGMGTLESATENVRSSAGEVNDAISGIDPAPAESISEALQTAAESGENAATQVLDVGNAEEELNDAPIENQAERLEHLGQTATDVAETIKDGAQTSGDAINSMAGNSADNALPTASFDAAEVSEWAMNLIDSGKSAEEVLAAIEEKMEQINNEMIDLDAHHHAGNGRPSHINHENAGALVSDSELSEDDKKKKAHYNREINKDAEALESLRMIAQDVREDYEGLREDASVAPSVDQTEEEQKEVQQSAEEFASRLKAAYEENYLQNLVEQYNELETKLDRYRNALAQIAEEEKRLQAVRETLRKEGLSGENIDAYNANEKRISDLQERRTRVEGIRDAALQEQSNLEGKIIKAAPREDELPAINSAEELDEKIEEIRSKIAQLKEEALSGEEDENGIINLNDTAENIQNAEKELKRYLAVYKAIHGEEYKSPEEQEAERQEQERKAQEQAQKAQEQAQKAEEQAQRDRERQEAQARQRQIAGEGLSVNDLKRRKRELEGGEIRGAQREVGRSDNAAESIQHVRDLERELQNINALLATSSQWSVGAELLGTVFARATRSAVGFAAQGLMKVNTGIAQIGTNAAKMLGSTALNGFKLLGQGALSAASALSQLASRGLGLLGQGVKAAMSGIANLAQKGFGLLRTGAQKAVASVSDLIGKFRNLGGNTSKKMLKSLTSIKSLLIRRIKRTFISGIFNQAKEGLQQFAKYSSAFNTSMSNIKNAAKGASGNLAVAMGNIVNAVAPALTTVINWISKAIQAFNSLWAMISGKSTVTVAKKSTDNYAKSLGNASSAAKDLNKQLYGFDEITRQDDNSSGGGGGGSSPIKYEEKDIGSVLGDDLQNTFQQIIDAFNSGQFERVGELVGGLFNRVVDTVDKKIIEFRSKATTWASNIARILNGLVSSINWGNLGKLFGDGFNLIFDTVNTFMKTFDFAALGKAFAEGINGLGDAVEWDLVGETLSNGFNSIWNLMNGFVSNFDFEGWGDHIAEGLSMFFDNLDWMTYSDNIAKGFNGIVKLFSRLIDGVNWNSIARKFGNAVGKVVKDIDWANAGKLFGKGFNTFWGAITTIFDTVDFSEMGNKFAAGANSIFETADYASMGEAVSKGFSSVFELIAGFVTDFNFEQLGTNIASGIQSLFDNVNWEALKTAVTEGVNGIVLSLSTAIAGVDWAGHASNIAKNANGIVAGIEWENIGTLLSEGLNGAFSMLSTFLNEFDWGSLGTEVATGVQALIDGVNWEDIRTSVSGYINGITDLFLGFVSGVDWTSLGSDVMTNLNTLITTDIDWDSISTLLSTSINSLIDIFDTLVTSDTIVNLASKLGALAGDFLKDINWDKLGEDIGVGVGKLVEAFGKLLTEMDIPGIASSLASGINNLFDPNAGGAGFETAVSALTDGINSLIAGFANLLDPEKGINFTQIAETLSTSINGLIKNTDWATLVETIAALGIELNDAMFTAIGNIDWSTLGTTLADSINGLFSDDNQNRLARLGESISAALKGALEGADTLLAGIDLGKIFDGFTTLITSIDWAGLLSKAFDLIVDAIPKLVAQIPTLLANLITLISNIPWVDIAKTVIEGIGNVLVTAVSSVATLVTNIVDMMKNINWLEVGKAILTGITDVLLSAASAVGGILSNVWNSIFGSEQTVEVPQVLSDEIMAQLKQQMGEAGRELASTLNNSLIESLDDAGSDYEAAKQFFLNSAAEIGMGMQEELEETLRAQNVSEETIAAVAENSRRVFEACKAPDATIASIKEEFRNNGIWITDGLAEAFLGEGSENIAAALQLMALGVDQETIAALDISNLNANLTQYMNDTGTDIKGIAAALGADVGEEIGDVIPEAVKNALGAGKEEVEKTADEIAAAADTSAQRADAENNAKATGKGVVTELQQGVGENISSVEDSANSISTTLDNKLKELPEEEKAHATQMMQYIVDGISEGDPLVTAAIEGAANALVAKAEEILAGDKGMAIALSFMEGIYNGVDYYRDSLGIQMNAIATDIINKADGSMNTDNGWQIGANMLIGMINGMNRYGQLLVDTLAHICNVTADTARQILGISSPSKVFAEIGGYVMEGMQIGLEDSGKDAINTVGNIAQAMASEANDTDISLAVDAMTDGLDTAISKMSTLAQIFNGIAEALADMGTMEIPTVASGRVLPYRARVGNTTSTETTNTISDRNELEDVLYAAMKRALGESEGDINVKLIADGRTLADIVTKYQRQQQRAWGV